MRWVLWMRFSNMKPALSLYRSILGELRLLNLQAPLKEDVFKYVGFQFRKYRETDEKYCRASESALNAGQTYLTMIQSARFHEVLAKQYGGRGDRTIAEAANIVGLSLPVTPHGA